MGRCPRRRRLHTGCTVLRPRRWLLAPARQGRGFQPQGYKGVGRNRGWNGAERGGGRHFVTRLEWGVEGGWNAHSAISRCVRRLLGGPLSTIRILPEISKVSIAVLSARLVMPSFLGCSAKTLGA